MEEKKKLYQKWWFWVCIVLFILIMGFILNFTNDTSTITSTNLNQKVTIGKLTYYVDNSWENTESIKENTTYNYYYPTNNTMLMVMYQTGDNYGDITTIDSFLDGYVSGMDLNDNDFISKEVKKINNFNYGIIKCYISQYETIQYVIPNNDEAYVFSFGQKSNLNDQNISIIENIVEKATITTEIKEEKQINEPNSNTQTNNIPNNNQSNISNFQTNTSTNEKPIKNHSQSSKTSTNTNQQQNNNSQTNKPVEQENPSTSQSKPNETQPTETVNIQSKYQAILNEYSTKLKNKTPSLITEYKNEASKNTGGLNGLATICNNKVSILAGISTEGIGKMADIYYKYGNGKYSEYENWARKLQDVYMEEANKIQDVYMDSAM